MIPQSIVNAVEILHRKGVEYAVLSPGSRNAPLILTFARHPHIQCLTIPDERTAGFTALGIAQATGRPVAVTTTSGTAALNLAPALAEAYYRHVPLIALTADRPPEWIDQADGQTIRQNSVFQNFVLSSFSLDTFDEHADALWFSQRMVSEAVNLSKYPVPGPVHINVPIREPFYPGREDQLVPDEHLKIINEPVKVQKPGDKTIERYVEKLFSFEKILIVSGQNAPHPAGGFLDRVSQMEKVPVAGEIISNVRANIGLAELILISGKDRETLNPDLLVSVGGPVLSKNLKLFLRSHRAARHWHLSEYGRAPDTFQSLTEVIAVSPEAFFEKLAASSIELSPEQADYFKRWKNLELKTAERLKSFLEHQPFGDWHAVKTVMEQLPDQSVLHLANSMSVRYASWSAPILRSRKWNTWSNRGTSGIDGCTSTAVGQAVADRNLQVLITGDQAFFYDRNALWHRHVPSNIRIVIINNHGGGIFRLVEGPAGLREMETYFEAGQSLTAERLAADHGLTYTACSDIKGLEKALESFFRDSHKPGILEIFTDPEINQEIFSKLRDQLSKR